MAVSRKIRKIGIISMTSLSCLACALSHELSNQSLNLLMKEEQDISNTTLQPWADLCLPAGAILGCVLCWAPLQFLGRRSTLELLSSPSLILGCCLTFTFYHLSVANSSEPPTPYIQYALLLGLWLQGLSNGFTFIASPIYVLETIGDLSCKSSSSLCLLLGTTQLSSAVAIAAASVFTVNNNSYFYHLCPAGLQIISLVGFYFLPESPRWLLLNKLRVDEAKTVLRGLKEHRSADYDVCRELSDYQKEEDGFKLRTSCQIETVTVYLHPLLIAVGLACLCHLYGVYVYSFYAAWAFRFAGFSMELGINTRAVSAAIQIASISVSTCVFFFYSKPIFHCVFLMLTSGLVTVALTVTGSCFYGFSQGDTWTANVSWLPLAAQLLSECAFWIGPGSQAYLLPFLITPAPLRPSISSIAGATYWLGRVMSARLVKPMINTLYPFGTFWFFAGMSTIGLIFLMCSVMPELNKTEPIIEEKPESLCLKSRVNFEETNDKMK